MWCVSWVFRARRREGCVWQCLPHLPSGLHSTLPTFQGAACTESPQDFSCIIALHCSMIPWFSKTSPFAASHMPGLHVSLEPSCGWWKNQPSYVHCGLRGKQNHNDTKPAAVLQLCETHLNHANTHTDLFLFWADLPVVSLCAEHLELLLHASHKLECFLNRHHVLTCVQSYVPYALQRHCAMQKGLAATARSPKLPNTCEWSLLGHQEHWSGDNMQQTFAW